MIGTGCLIWSFRRPEYVQAQPHIDEKQDEAPKDKIDALTSKFPRPSHSLPSPPIMMRFPTAAATRAAAFVATRSANNPAASSALRFSALRAMSAAAPGPKVRQCIANARRPCKCKHDELTSKTRIVHVIEEIHTSNVEWISEKQHKVFVLSLDLHSSQNETFAN